MSTGNFPSPALRRDRIAEVSSHTLIRGGRLLHPTPPAGNFAVFIAVAHLSALRCTPVAERGRQTSKFPLDVYHGLIVALFYRCEVAVHLRLSRERQ